MITRIPKKSASAKDLLDYLQGRKEQRGRLVDTNLAGRSTAAWALEIEDVGTSRPRASANYVKHLILSFPRDERPHDDDLVAISRLYLERMGYREAPYFAYLHTDRDHWHIHIVTTPTTFEGKAVSERWDWPRSERAAREIEKRWELTPVPSSRTARLASATSEERGAAAREDATPARTLFQYEIATEAAESRTFLELLERLDARGFEVRVAIDRNGQLRGLSFARDGFQFKGSELGRDFSGSRLLRAYGLDYEPKRDAAIVASIQARVQERGEAEQGAPARELRDILAARLEQFAPDASSRHDESLREERARLARDLARVETNPVVTARELESLPRPSEAQPLPAGTYTLVAVKPEALEGREPRIHDEDCAVVAKSWTKEQIEAALPALVREHDEHDLLLRTHSQTTSVLGFRNVSEAQLDQLRGAGFEPALVVRMGDRYDAQFVAHAVFNSEEHEAARQALAERFGLTVTSGVFREAVHAPGSTVHLDGRREEAVLVEVRTEPFSASPELLDEARRRAGELEIEREARAWSLPRAQEDAPAVVVAEVLRDREAPRAAGPERLTHLQEAIDFERREPQRRSAELALLTLGELRERIAGENRIALDESGADRESLRAAAAGASRLLELERELAARRHEAESFLGQAETRIGGAVRAIANARAQELPEASTTEPARALAEAVTALREAERNFLSHVAAQTEGDTARLGRYADTEHGNAVRESFAWRVERTTELAARRGEPTTAPTWPSGPARSVAERIEQDLLRRVEETRDAARAGLLAVRATSVDDPHLAYLFAVHARDVARGSAEAALRVEPGDARARLTDAAERIAHGDLSPDALRRAASAAFETRPEVALTSSRSLPHALEALAERYSALSNDLREGARAFLHTNDSPSGPRSHSGLERVFVQASELVRLHQRVEALERKQLGLPEPRLGLEPGAAARGLAWLSMATEKGLEPTHAAAHLANATRETFVAIGSAGLSIAESLARSVALQASTASLEHVRRVMHS